MAVKAKATITLAAVKDIDSIYWFYKLQASTAAAPTKSGLTAAAIKGDPPTGWSDSEPTYTSGSTQTLYIVEQTYYTDGTNEFSEVSKSTSYEAAKAAWNKADNAESVATEISQQLSSYQYLKNHMEYDSETGVLTLQAGQSNFKITMGNRDDPTDPSSPPKLSFWEGNQEVAYISGNQLYIPYSVVLNAMDIGLWRWKKEDDNSLTLQWTGGAN